MEFQQDLRYSLRSLAKSPLLTGAAVLTLGLGIGANTAMFEVVDRLFFKPPQYVTDPAHVVRIQYLTTARAFGQGAPYVTQIGTYPRYEWFRDFAHSFSSVAAYGSHQASLGLGATAERVDVEMATASLFPLLGVRPALGRFFTVDEDRLGAGAHVAIISHELWKRRFGGRPDALGKTLDLGQGVYTIIGVAPDGFSGVELQVPDVWLPVTAGAPEFVGKDALGPNWWWLSGAIARLRSGVTPASATAEATAVFRAHGEAHDSDTVVLGSVHDLPGAQSGVKLTIWLSVVCGIVLLIACANVANLLLARAVQRRREFAVRLALGATRARLLQQLLTESLIISVIGGAVAIVLTLLFAHVLFSSLLQNATMGSPLNLRVLLFTAAVVIGTVLVAGLAPGLLSSAQNLGDALKTGVREGNTSRSKARKFLLATQVALTVVLLTGAGLFVASLRNVSGIPVGFDADHVISVSEDLRPLGYGPVQINDAYRRVADRLRSEPGVTGVTLTVGNPWGWGMVISMSAPGLDSLPQFTNGGPYISAVMPNYFQVMGTRILRGRAFTDADQAGSPLVTVISQSMADLYWPHQDPIGKCLLLMRERRCTEVVGVAENTHRSRLVEHPGGAFYVPFVQSDSTVSAPFAAILVRTRGEAQDLSGRIQLVIQGSFAELPYPRVNSYPTLFASELRPWKVGSTLLSLFGLLGLVLAGIGLYGILSYAVTQRTQEMGIRIALGATRGDVLSLIVGQGLWVTLAGVGVGILASLLAGKAVASLFYGISPWNPVILGLVAVILATIAIAASYLPGLRATKVDPMVALRYE